MLKRIRLKTNRNKVNKSVTERHLKVLEFVLIKVRFLFVILLDNYNTEFLYFCNGRSYDAMNLFC